MPTYLATSEKILASFHNLLAGNAYVGPLYLFVFKGQTNSKLYFQADVSSKKRTNKFDFTTCRLVFVRFLEESEDAKRHFEIN